MTSVVRPMRDWARASTLVAAALCAGCAATQHMQPGKPIQRRGSGLGYTYLQDGEEISRSDMIGEIQQVQNARSALSGYQPSTGIAYVVGTVGGAMIGWPVGAAVAGNPEPPWLLAGIGAGLVVLAVPLAMSAEAALARAVDAYNASLKVPARHTRERAAAPVPAIGPRRDRLDAAARAEQEAGQRERLARFELAHREWKRDVSSVDRARAPYTTFMFITAGAGVVLLGTGGYFLIESRNLDDDARDAVDAWTLSTAQAERDRLARRLVELQSDRDLFVVLGGSLLAAGGVSLAASLVLLLARPARLEEPVKPLVTRDGAGLLMEGTF
jgi:uncharacterized membrane protein YfcA